MLIYHCQRNGRCRRDRSCRGQRNLVPLPPAEGCIRRGTLRSCCIYPASRWLRDHLCKYPEEPRFSWASCAHRRHGQGRSEWCHTYAPCTYTAYRTLTDHQSLYSTPPVLSIHISDFVLKEMLQESGKMRWKTMYMPSSLQRDPGWCMMHWRTGGGVFRKKAKEGSGSQTNVVIGDGKLD